MGTRINHAQVGDKFFFVSANSGTRKDMQEVTVSKVGTKYVYFAELTSFYSRSHEAVIYKDYTGSIFHNGHLYDSKDDYMQEFAKETTWDSLRRHLSNHVAEGMKVVSLEDLLTIAKILHCPVQRDWRDDIRKTMKEGTL